MDTIERRALYHLLRMNWLNEPTLSVESWQVEDYRALPLSDLWERLKQFNLHLDPMSFAAYARDCDSPEELTEHLIGDRSLSTLQEDSIYLLVFEIWRRLMGEKPSLSILCDELDHQIFLYDCQKLDNLLALQDALTHFIHVLEKNVDEGMAEEEAFCSISHYCAHDVEGFLYDFVTDQIEGGNEAYAQDVLDDFDPYLTKNKWFKLLRLRLCEPISSKIIQKIAGEILEEHLHEKDLNYYLECLSILSEKKERLFFRLILREALSLIQQEEELQDVLMIAIDHLERLEHNSQKHTLEKAIERRSANRLNQPVATKDPDLVTLYQLFQLDSL